MGLAKQWRGVSGYMIRDPDTFFSAYDETHGIGYPLQYLLVTFAVVFAPLLLLSALLIVVGPSEALVGVTLALGLAILMWIGTVVEALIVHGIAYLLGARGLAKTLEAYAFPAIIRYGLWWFLPINIVLGLYGWYLQVKGLSEFHDISTGRAVIAAGIPLVLCLLPGTVLLAAVIGAFVLGFEGGTSTPPPGGFRF